MERPDNVEEVVGEPACRSLAGTHAMERVLPPGRQTFGPGLRRACRAFLTATAGPLRNSGPFGITVAPNNGDLWYTMMEENKIATLQSR
jgi:hypothetical protein